MDWAEAIVEALKAQSVRLLAYVPDAITWRVLAKAGSDPLFHLVPCTREDEAIALAAGFYLGRQRAATFMQSSGFGNCINALASLALPAQIPVPLFVGMRGDLWEHNVAQVPGGRSVAPIMQALGMGYTLLDDPAPEAVRFYTEGALFTAFSTRTPIGVLIGPRLSGRKRGGQA